jgi:hypothetical protein
MGKIIAILAVALAISGSATAHAQNLNLNLNQNPYGNSSNSPRLYAPDGQFLGNVNANRYDPDSIANPYGQYGSPYSPNSVHNPYAR